MTKYCVAILHQCFVLSSNFNENFETWSKTSKFQMAARYFGGKPIIDGLVFTKQKAWQATKARTQWYLLHTRTLSPHTDTPAHRYKLGGIVISQCSRE